MGPLENKQPENSWSQDQSSRLYGINNWGGGYFSINPQGNVQVIGPKDLSNSEKTRGVTKGLDLFQMVLSLKERGIRLPLILRFSNILAARLKLLYECFGHSIKEESYKGTYYPVYPIKVNQQSHLIEELMCQGGQYSLGLECGSKSELLISLAMGLSAKTSSRPPMLVCNGFKDAEYIETTLLAQKIGAQVFVVIDRFEELEIVCQRARALKIEPLIGFRLKLNARGAGRWMESCGAHSKFGLTPPEIIKAVETLKAQNMLQCLSLLHFHLGSQIPSIQHIKTSLKEAARFYVELYHMGAQSLRFLDVGGGLGVNYDGSRMSDSSCNYTEQEYANDVISIVKSICDDRSVPHPHIISESGRSLVAHSSVLVFDVLGANSTPHKAPLPHAQDSMVVKDLFYIYKTLTQENLNEYYNDLIEKNTDAINLFAYGALTLSQRAKAEALYWAICYKINNLARGQEAFEDLYWKLQKELAGIYYCNFSIFQSLPDSWAMRQVFPVMPLQRLCEKPDKRVILADLTCDSDGKLNRFIDPDTFETQNFIEVHSVGERENYFIGVFLTGAYQETLGDLHNLFGDTNAVHISVDHNGQYSIDHVVRGDNVSDLLGYLSYERPNLVERIRQATEGAIHAQKISLTEAHQLLQHYDQALNQLRLLAKSVSDIIQHSSRDGV